MFPSFDFRSPKFMQKHNYTYDYDRNTGVIHLPSEVINTDRNSVNKVSADISVNDRIKAVLRWKKR